MNLANSRDGAGFFAATQVRKQAMAKANLTIAQRFSLMNLIKEDYETRKQSDIEYAVYAADKLNIPQLNNNHVASSRDALGIQATKFATSTPVIESRVTLLERRLAELESLVNVLRKDSHTHVTGNRILGAGFPGVQG